MKIIASILVGYLGIIAILNIICSFYERKIEQLRKIQRAYLEGYLAAKILPPPQFMVEIAKAKAKRPHLELIK